MQCSFNIQQYNRNMVFGPYCTVTESLIIALKNIRNDAVDLPGKAPPGSGEGAEDGSERQGGEKRVEREIQQSLHPIIAQAFQREIGRAHV